MLFSQMTRLCRDKETRSSYLFSVIGRSEAEPYSWRHNRSMRKTTLLKNLSRLKELSIKKVEPSVLQVRQTFPIETLAALKVLVWLSFCLLGLLYSGIKERVKLKTSLNEVKRRLKRWRVQEGRKGPTAPWVPIGSNYLSKFLYYIQCINPSLTRSSISVWPGMTSMNFNERVLTFESACLTWSGCHLLRPKPSAVDRTLCPICSHRHFYPPFMSNQLNQCILTLHTLTPPNMH